MNQSMTLIESVTLYSMLIVFVYVHGYMFYTLRKLRKDRNELTTLINKFMTNPT